MSGSREGLVALLTTLVAGPLVLWVLRRARVLDHPSSRSAHDHPVPRGGGLAPMCGILVGLAVSDHLGDPRTALIVIGAGFGLLGLAEDLIGLSPTMRLFAQVVLAVFPVIGVLDTSMAWPVAILSTLVGVCWVVGFTNAFNFMDGIDGISVAQAGIAGAFWFIAGTVEDEQAFAVGAALLAASAVGFAPFNLPPARMFLGDCGSYLFGSLMALLAVIGLQSGLPPEVVAFPVGLYLVDTGWTLSRRVLAGEDPFVPHDGHIYQQMARSTSHRHTTGIVLLAVTACSALGLVSLVGRNALRVIADLSTVVILAAYVIAPRVLRATKTSRL